MTELAFELARWALMNDAFYAETGTLVKQLADGATIQDLYERRRSRVTKKIPSPKEYESRLERVLESGVDLLRVTDPGYPERLLRTPSPPLLLYRKGNALSLRKAVAVAGRRNLSSKGHADARALGRNLASEGLLVVSGLARGADTEAHCGALEGDGQTVAVLAGWLEDIYPKENANLSRDIVQNGALFTMTSPLKRVQKHYFIRRNRITSGISRCLIIVESDGKGGTARQVDWAVEQGRPVFVLHPDSSNHETMSAYRHFLAQGAKGFSDVDSLVEFVTDLDFGDATDGDSRSREITDY